MAAEMALPSLNPPRSGWRRGAGCRRQRRRTEEEGPEGEGEESRWPEGGASGGGLRRVGGGFVFYLVRWFSQAGGCCVYEDVKINMQK